MNTTPEFDIAPLSWIREEVGHSLKSALDLLKAQESGTPDADQLRQARTWMHQVSGALDMVGLRGVSLVSQETENLLQHFESASDPTTTDTAPVRASIETIELYLDDLLRGKPNQELQLFPVYRQLREARGITRHSETDLFFPDLDTGTPDLPGSKQMVDEQRIALFRQARARFQRGLLSFLRQNNPDSGLQLMHDAIRDVESAMTTSSARTFWWGCGAFVDSLQTHSIEPGFEVKQLCGRIDLQLRRHIEGSNKIAERLLRDLLFFIANSRDGSERISQVKQSFNLTGLIPSTRSLVLADAEVRQANRQALNLLNMAKDDWTRLTSGNIDSLMHFQVRADELLATSHKISLPALQPLIREIHHIAIEYRSIAPERLAQVQIEVATALLLIQSALEQYDEASEDLASQINVMTQHLQAIAWTAQGDESTVDLPLLEQISRQAQERSTMAQVVLEIQHNLHRTEEILDNFFRSEPRDHTSLGDLIRPLHEMDGAFRILQWNDAQAILEQITRMVEQLRDSSQPPDENLFPLLAEAVSSLGLYAEAEKFHQDDAKRLLEPVLIHLGLLNAPDEIVSDGSAGRIEDEIMSLKTSLTDDLASWELLGATDDTKKKLTDILNKLGQDAELVNDHLLRHQVAEALRQLKTEPVAPQNLRAIFMPASEQPVAESGTDEEESLLDIFIEEAASVVDSTRENLASLHNQPTDQHSLREFRRGFHTLKGSGRMVGLTDLGETAWAVEQLLNLWLQENRIASPELLGLLDRAHQHFSHWIEALIGGHAYEEDHAALIRACDALREGGQPEEPGETGFTDATTDDEHQSETLSGIGEDTDASPASLVEAEPDEEVVQESSENPHAASEDAGIGLDSDDIRVDDIIVSASLLDIYRREAATHLETITRELASSQNAPDTPVSSACMRAAHTLAGTSRLTGFLAVANLAHALEFWLQPLVNHDSPIPADQHELVQATRDALQHMLQTITDGHNPAERIDLIEQLEKSKPSPATMPVMAEELVAEEPVAEEPVAEEPVAEELVAEELVAEEPVAEEPVAEEPVAEELVAEELVAEEPVAEEPVAEEAMVEMPDQETHALISPVREHQPVPEQYPEMASAPASGIEIHDDIDVQLLPIFLEEASELLPEIERNMREWQANPEGNARPSLQRLLHTLKGSARMAGAMRLGQMTHEMESAVELSSAEAGDISQLAPQVDQIALAIDALSKGESPSQPAQPAGSEVTDGQVAASPAVAVSPQPALQEGEAQSQTLRVRSEILEELINEAGEISISRSRLENSTSNLRNSAHELTENAERLRAQLRELEIQAESQMQSTLSHLRNDETGFDPLEFDRFTRLQELTRMMAESLNDIQTVQQNLLSGINETDSALTQQGRLARTLQQSLMHIRMVPLASVIDRLHRTVRLAAREESKKASLQINGEDVEFDRSVLEKIIAPLEHILRNSIAHGIEKPEDRLAAGKSEYGEITLDVRQQGNEIVLVIRDDGQGLNLEAIRRTAIQNGLLNEDDRPGDEELQQLIFASGFSTAREVTTLSGRGVGMDVVRNDIQQLGGRIELQSVSGHGLTTTINLPLTMTVTQAVLVRTGDRRWAIPSAMIGQVQEYKSRQLPELLKSGQIVWQEQNYPLAWLPELLGDEGIQPGNESYSPVLLLRSGHQRAAIMVDEISSNQEIVVKKVGPQLTSITGISGATVLGNGEIVLILNPIPLIQRRLHQPAHDQSHPIPVATPQSTVGSAATCILVVDDSLTVRKITSRLLQREGFNVNTAKDGIDALQVMQHRQPDLILLDIEMPRMDGFEFAHIIRSDPRTAGLPIVMITSRTADKHREHAEKLGVNAYLGKPYQEDRLLQVIRNLLGEHQMTVA